VKIVIRQVCDIVRFFLLAMFAGPVFALDPARDFNQYASDSWSVEQGLPQISITAIAQDQRGYIWIGTRAGLARFDGVKFVEFSRDKDPAFASNVINDLLLMPDGRLLVATDQGLLAQIDDHFQMIPSDKGPNQPIYCLLKRVDGVVLVGAREGLFSVKGERLHSMGFATNPIYSLLESQNSVLAGTDGGVIQITGSVGKLAVIADSGRVRHLAQSQAHVFAGTDRGLFVSSNSNDFVRQSLPAGDIESSIELLALDHAGVLWLSTQKQAYRMKKQQFEPLSDGQMGGLQWLTSFYEDDQGNTWLGSYTLGLWRLWDGWAWTIDSTQGIKDPHVWSVLADRQDRLWFGTQTSVGALQDDRAAVNFSTEKSSNSAAYSLYAGAGNALWVGTRDGAWRLQEGTLQQLPELAPLRGHLVTGFVEPGPGSVWIATDEGLFHYADKLLRKFGHGEGFPDKIMVRAIIAPTPEQLYIGTEEGLYYAQEERFSKLQLSADSERNIAVSYLSELSPTDLLIGTFDDGLYIGKNGHFKHLTVAHGLPMNSIYSVVKVADDVWFSNQQSVYKIKTQELADFMQNESLVHPQIVVSTNLSVSGAQHVRCCNGGSLARVAVLVGILYYPSTRGIVRIDPSRIKPTGGNSKTIIEALTHAGKRTNAQQKNLIDSGDGDLGIEFTAIALRDPLGIEFQYKLDGYDDDWRSAGNARAVQYTHLPGGDYVFRLKARLNPQSPFGPENQIDLRIQPKWFETRVTRALATGGLVSAALIGFLFYARMRKKREQLLEQLVNERTAELNQANERLYVLNRALSEESVSDTLTGLKNRRGFLSQINQWRNKLIDFTASSRRGFYLMVLDLDHFKRVNDNFGHAIGDELLQQFTLRLQERLTTGCSLYRWGGEEFLIVCEQESVPDIRTLAESLRQHIAAQPFATSSGGKLRMTMSVGFAMFPVLANRSDIEQPDIAVDVADAALYRAKQNGRNRCCGAVCSPKMNLEQARMGIGDRAEELAQNGFIRWIEWSTKV
jgi:diguanylate cyclase (GGDEF)-like protein